MSSNHLAKFLTNLTENPDTITAVVFNGRGMASATEPSVDLSSVASTSRQQTWENLGTSPKIKKPDLVDLTDEVSPGISETFKNASDDSTQLRKRAKLQDSQPRMLSNERRNAFPAEPNIDLSSIASSSRQLTWEKPDFVDLTDETPRVISNTFKNSCKDSIAVVGPKGAFTETPNPQSHSELRLQVVSEKSPNSIDEFLQLWKQQISKKSKFISFSRSTAMNDLYKLLDDGEFSILDDVFVHIIGEKGVGSGVKNEFFTLVLQQIKESSLLEGTTFKKTFISSRPSERRGEYYKMGRAMSLILLHGGPPPRFFSETFWNLLIGKQIEDATDDLLNENVRAQINSVASAGNNVAKINSTYVQCDIFKCARTYDQIIEPNALQKRDEAIQDAVHYYCVESLEGPMKQFREGLDQEVPFVAAFKKNEAEAKKLFCYSNDAPLTAIMVQNLFDTRFSSDKDRITYHKWTRYLQYLQDEPTKNHNLNRMLQLVTGLDSIPPLGFSPPRPTVYVSELCYPKTQTCFNKLYLPSLVSDYKEFQSAMDVALTLMEFDDS